MGNDDGAAAQEWAIPPGRVYSYGEIRAILTREGSPLEMEDAVIRGSTYKVFKNTPPDLRGLLHIARAHGDKTFLVLNNERLTFDESCNRIARIAAALIKAGVKKGDRVAILMRNVPEWVLSFWAGLAVGAIVVPINGWLKPVEIEFCLRDCSATALFVDPERLKPLISNVAAMRKDGLLKTIIVARQTKLDASFAKVGAVTMHAFETSVPATEDLPDVDIESDDDANIFYTSGTTGKPKGALLTHRNFITFLFSAAAFGSIIALRAGEGIPLVPKSQQPGALQDAVLLGVPLFHATGALSVMGGSLASGRKMVMMDKWDTKAALELIQREKITSFGGVPTLVWQIMEHPDLQKYDLTTIDNIWMGGAPAAPELIATINKRLPHIKIRKLNGYGLSETSAAVTANVGIDYERKPDSVGLPTFINEIKITKPGTWEFLPQGSVGEIAIRGPSVCKGYWNNPAANAKSFSPDGWFLSGDIGRIDDEGFVYVMDRAKDMLIRGGENIYCVEVEDCIYKHEAVMDCAIVGVYHKVLGEEPAAVVQVKPDFLGKVKPDDIIKHCRERIAKFKCPVFVQIRKDPLPRNANGKILKVQLREEVAKVTGRKAKL